MVDSVSTTLRATDILITSEVLRRPERTTRLEAELRAFAELASIMRTDARRAVRRFLELAIDLCDAGSAGLSVLQPDESGETVFHWDALAGAFASYEGGTTPRGFSPRGLCLDAGETIVLARPARMFPYFDHATPAIVEGLIVPLYDNARRPIGTLWVVHHDEQAQFSPNDLRVMEELATQLVLAIKLAEERESFAALSSERERERAFAAAELDKERADRERAQESASGLWRAVNAKDMLIQEIKRSVDRPSWSCTRSQFRAIKQRLRRPMLMRRSAVS